MANFIGMVFATLQKEGVDTKGMSTDEAVKKFNELKGKSGGDNTKASNNIIEGKTIKNDGKQIGEDKDRIKITDIDESKILKPNEVKRLRELGVGENSHKINKDYNNAKGAVRDYSTALNVAESRLKKDPGNKALQGRVSALRRDLKHYQSIVDEYENK